MAKRRQTVSSRNAAARLLKRRSGLAGNKDLREQAKKLAESVGYRITAVDAMAIWFGRRPDASLDRLASQLEQRLDELPRDTRPLPLRRADAALALAWRDLPGELPRELLHALALFEGEPVPRIFCEQLANEDPDAVENLIESGLARLNDGAGLWAHEQILDFVGRLPEHGDPGRCLRCVDAMRELAQDGDPSEPVIDELAERLFHWADQARQGGLIASLCHRMISRLRGRGALEDASQWVGRGLTPIAAGDVSARPLEGLLLLDAGLVGLDMARPGDALAHLMRAVTVLEQAEQAGRSGATDLLRLAREAKGQALCLAAKHRSGAAALAQTLSTLPESGVDPSADVVRATASLALGLARCETGDDEEALALLRDARARWRELTSADDQDGGFFDVGLARAPIPAEEREALLEAARVHAGGEMDRPMHRVLPLVLHELAIQAADDGDDATAAARLDEAAMLAMSLLPDGHPIRLSIDYSRALVFLAQGDLARARTGLAKVHDAREAILMHNDPLIEVTRAAQAWVRYKEGGHRSKQAAKQLLQAESALADAFGSTSAAASHLRKLRRQLGR